MRQLFANCPTQIFWKLSSFNWREDPLAFGSKAKMLWATFPRGFCFCIGFSDVLKAKEQSLTTRLVRESKKGKQGSGQSKVSWPSTEPCAYCCFLQPPKSIYPSLLPLLLPPSLPLIKNLLLLTAFTVPAYASLTWFISYVPRLWFSQPWLYILFLGELKKHQSLWIPRWSSG